MVQYFDAISCRDIIPGFSVLFGLLNFKKTQAKVKSYTDCSDLMYGLNTGTRP